MMNFNSFMRKLDGVEDYEATNSKTTEARPLDMQGINELIARRGDNLPYLEERSEISRSRVELFWAGYNGDDFRASMGVYLNGTLSDGTDSSRFYWLGLGYKLSDGDTHSQQQDSVPPTTSRGLAGPDWSPSSCDDELSIDLDELRGTIRNYNECFSRLGSTPSSPLTREGPEGSAGPGHWADAVEW